MRLGKTKIICAMSICVYMAATAQASEAAPAPIVEEKKLEALPGGNSDAFRDRMLNWSAPGLPESGTKEVLAGVSTGNLYISSPFGWRSDPIRGIQRRHAGVDLPGPPLTSIHSTGEGIVRIAGRAGGYGNLVEIEHPGGVRTRYGHLARILVSAGAAVRQGEVIGRMGSTGRSTGTHLHYEVRVNGMPVNPMNYIGQTIPSYQTSWALEVPVSARWAGWSDSSGGYSLPGAKIR
jgi:murein DD-endopeptidase MepM/ murein hydrolase activator NlpD